MKERIDKILVEKGLADTRQKARALIMAGLVFAGDRRIEKAGTRLAPDADIRIKETMPFVGRGGLKLRHALAEFRLDVTGITAADLGSSTGGFTDCLLQNGAKKVFAVDVDPRQFDWGLSRDARVVLIKKNARYLEKSDFSEPVDLVTVDLSFISLLKVLPAVRRILDQGDVLPLVKPQFEVGRSQVGKKGVVKDPKLHSDALLRVAAGAADQGYRIHGIIPSPILGQKGNREFFLHLSLGRTQEAEFSMEDRIKEVVGYEGN